MLKGKEQFLIRAQDIDRYSRAKVSALIAYMQEVAWENAASLGASVTELQKQGISWVMTRIKLEIFRYPVHQETITVRSWPSGHERTFVYRDYFIYDETDALIAQASSTWLVFDMKTRRMIRVPEQFHGIIHPHPTVPPLPRAKDRLRITEEMEPGRQLNVRWHDLDSNDHVSNFLFFQWPLEALSPDWLASRQLQSIDLIIKAEVTWGDRILTAALPVAANEYLHQITRQADGKEVARALTKWRPV